MLNPQREYQLVERDIDLRKKAFIAFNPSDVMYLDDAETVTVRLSTDLTESSISKGMLGQGTPHVEPERAGEWAYTAIFGDRPGQFEIQPVASPWPDVQPIPKGASRSGDSA